MQAWGVSAFHALHCLAVIRGALQSARGLSADGGGGDGHGHGQGHGHGGGVGHGHGGGVGDEGGGDHYSDPKHVMHCFSYLAQVSGLSDKVAVGKRGDQREFLLTGCAIGAAVQRR